MDAMLGIELISGFVKGVGIGLGTLAITATPYLYKKAKTTLLGKDKGGSQKNKH